jgi:diguanylate cyclase (GGDEF)-like protein
VTAARDLPEAHPRLPDSSSARLHALTEIARAAAGGQSTDVVLRRSAQAARRALGAASLSVSVWERDRAQVRVLLNDGDLAPGELPDPVDEVYPLTEYPFLETTWAFGEPQVQQVDQPPSSPGHDAALVRLLERLGKGSCLSVPINLEGRVWGELFVTRHVAEPPYTVADGDYALAVAAQLAAALAQGEHLDRVARLAYTDQLTGLANRRAVDDRLDAALARHRTDGTVVSLIVVDVNGLKQINDQRGHEAGDRALAHFAGLLSASAALVPGSLAGRIGGDEFCVVIEGNPADHAVWVAEDICRRARAGLEDGVACGVASTGDPVGPVDSAGRLFRLADAAQSRAKRSRARGPVVAGRGLRAEAAIRLAERTARPRGRAVDRRRVRGRTATPPFVLEDVLRTLDHAPADGVQSRLEVVGDAVARLVDAAGWWVSRAERGSNLLRTVRFSTYRLTGAEQPEHSGFSAAGAEFDLAEYPYTAAVLDGGGAVLLTTDPDIDAAELAVLDAGGYTGVLMAGGPDRVGDRWLVEVYVDEISAELGPLGPTLRALVACALLTGPGR